MHTSTNLLNCQVMPNLQYSHVKEKAENNVKVRKIPFWNKLSLWNSHIHKKEKVFHFSSQQQKVQRFYILIVLIHLTIFVVIYLEQIFHTYEETRWLICTSRNWTLQLKLTFWVKMQVVSLWIPLLSLQLQLTHLFRARSSFTFKQL